MNKFKIGQKVIYLDDITSKIKLPIEVKITNFETKGLYPHYRYFYRIKWGMFKERTVFENELHDKIIFFSPLYQLMQED